MNLVKNTQGNKQATRKVHVLQETRCFHQVDLATILLEPKVWRVQCPADDGPPAHQLFLDNTPDQYVQIWCYFFVTVNTLKYKFVYVIYTPL